MARLTVFGVTVLVEKFTQAFGAANVGFDAWNSRRRWCWMLAEDAFIDPDSAQHRRSVSSIGGYLEDASLGKKAAPGAVSGKRYRLDLG